MSESQEIIAFIKNKTNKQTTTKNNTRSYEQVQWGNRKVLRNENILASIKKKNPTVRIINKRDVFEDQSGGR